MFRHFFYLSFFISSVNLLQAQSEAVFIGKPVSISADNPLNQSLKAYQIFDIESSAIKAFLQEEQNGDKRFELRLPGMNSWHFALQLRPLLSSTYRLRVDDGKKITEMPSPGDITWKGRLAGSASSRVALTVTDRFIFGSIQAAHESWFIEPLSGLLPNAAPDRFIVYRTSDVIENPARVCGVTEVKEKKDKEQVKHSAENMVGQCKHVELAIASANDMYTRYDNSVINVENHNIGVMNAVANDYDSDFADDLYFLVATQYVSTTTTSSLDAALTATTDANTLLNNFTSWGNAGNFGVTLDDGQLWTARNICDATVGCGVVGLAWVGTVCNSNRYHLLEDYTGKNPGGTNWELRVMTSHEMGHNFSCNHDAVGAGTIMAPSVNNTSTWSAQSITQLNAYIGGTISCLAICGANFPSTSYSAAEGSSSNSLPAGTPSCSMGYTDFSIPVVYSGSTAGGSVSVSVVGGTATEGLDFELPSATVDFPPGATGQTVNLIVRIWNDAHVEGNETIDLQLGGAGAGSQNSTTVTIVSNDKDPVTDYYNYLQVGAGNTSISAPFLGSVSDGRTQIVFSASDLSAVGFAANDIITALAIEVISKGSTGPYNGFTIKMKHTSSANNSTAAPENGGFTTVYSSNYSTFVGWNKFDLTQGFVWNGSSNIKVEFCYDNASASGDDVVRSVNTPTTVFRTSSSVSGCSLSSGGWSWYNARPNTRLYKGTEIAITLNDEANTNLKNGQTAYFKDAQNEFILAVKQTSGADAGCVNVKIDRAGTSRQTMPGVLPAGGFVSNKTFLLTADNPSNYDLTLYYSKSEMSVWGTGTSSLNILKSTGPISGATVGNSSINTAITRATFGPTSDPTRYYSFKGAFNNGVAGFAVTNSTALPVEWLRFSGKLNDQTVQLVWETAQEQDNLGFDVERSTGGAFFEKIGFVPGRETLAAPQPYFFDDEKAMQAHASVLYYRLRQIDTDGHSSYSKTVPIALPDAQVSYLLYPNPARDELTLQRAHCDGCSATPPSPMPPDTLHCAFLRPKISRSLTSARSRQEFI